jgi:hypothetical protein
MDKDHAAIYKESVDQKPTTREVVVNSKRPEIFQKRINHIQGVYLRNGIQYYKNELKKSV